MIRLEKTMGRGASTGNVHDYFKKRHQSNKGAAYKRNRKLSPESEERRRKLRAEQRRLRREQSPSQGYRGGSK